MPGWMIAMLGIGAVLILRDMAKTFLEIKKSRREAAVYDQHPQKLEMERYADAFRVLADSLDHLPAPGDDLTDEEMDRMMEKQRQTICSHCQKYHWCWEQYYYVTRGECREFLLALLEENPERQNLLRGDWISHCLSGSRFLELLENQCRTARQEQVWRSRVTESRRCVAEQLHEVAGILNQAAGNLYSLNSVPGELEEKIRRQMKKQGAIVQKVWIQEKPKEHLQIFVTMRAGRRSRLTLRQAAGILSELCGIRLTAAREGSLSLCGEFQTFLFREDVKFQVLSGVARITKEKESVSGDSYSTVCENGEVILCLSDGMGSGLSASRESENVVELLEEFLRSGFSREMAARMINSSLLLRRDDGMFCTLDLATINLYTGMAGFLKAGAAPTWIRRDAWIDMISSASPAAGMLQELEFETASRKLYDGDYVVLVTDGVMDALPEGREEEEFRRILAEIHPGEPRQFARELLERVLQTGNYRAKDDMTVLAARIWKK